MTLSLNECYLHICAVEGPAGSGKSTLIRELVREYPEDFVAVDPLVWFDRPRNYEDNTNGAGLSLLKDVSHFLEALRQWSNDPSSTIYLIDRFLLSQIVYGTLRLGTHIPRHVIRAYRQSLNTLGPIALDFLSRSNTRDFSIGAPPKIWPRLHVMTLVNIPSTEIIIARREREPDRMYPYAPETERHLYYSVSDLLHEPILVNESHDVDFIAEKLFTARLEMALNEN